MKLDEINKQSISRASNTELTSVHRRLHQLFGSASRFPKPSDKIKGLLLKIKKIHKVVVGEMLKRGIKHQSNFIKEETSMSRLDRYVEYILEDDRFVFGEEGPMIPAPLRMGELLLERGKKKWIPKNLKKGALHQQLGVPEDEKIPVEKLKVKPSDSPKLKRRKILAKTFKRMAAKRKKKGEE
jgi:hypothetical protein